MVVVGAAAIDRAPATAALSTHDANATAAGGCGTEEQDRVRSATASRSARPATMVGKRKMVRASKHSNARQVPFYPTLTSAGPVRLTRQISGDHGGGDFGQSRGGPVPQRSSRYCFLHRSTERAATQRDSPPLADPLPTPPSSHSAASPTGFTVATPPAQAPSAPRRPAGAISPTLVDRCCGGKRVSCWRPRHCGQDR